MNPHPEAYYNEHDPKAAAWLRELIAEGHLPPGYVDQRSILDVRPHEIAAYPQQHFFAGLGGWPYALRLAGWPDTRPVRTGSCPCQPFSGAGKGLAEKDPRHLWPAFRDLIVFGEATITFGEQVASALGRQWLAGVRADLEALGYAVGAADLCAASLGAPHIRQRLYWMAYAGHGKRWRPNGRESRSEDEGERGQAATHSEQCRRPRGLADATRSELPGGLGNGDEAGSGRPSIGSASGGLGHAGRQRGGRHSGAIPGEERESQRERSGDRRLPHEPLDAGPSRRMAHVRGHGWQQGAEEICRRESVPPGGGPPRGMGDAEGEHERRPWQPGENEGREGEARRPGPWSDCTLIPCADGKARRVESGTFPLAHGVPGRVGLLRGYGNAIVPQLAAQFIAASLEALA